MSENIILFNPEFVDDASDFVFIIVHGIRFFHSRRLAESRHIDGDDLIKRRKKSYLF